MGWHHIALRKKRVSCIKNLFPACCEVLRWCPCHLCMAAFVSRTAKVSLKPFAVFAAPYIPAQLNEKLIYKLCLILIKQVSLITARRVTKSYESCILISCVHFLKGQEKMYISPSWHVTHTWAFQYSSLLTLSLFSLLFSLCLCLSFCSQTHRVFLWGLDWRTGCVHAPLFSYLGLCIHYILQRAGSSKWAWLRLLLCYMAQPDQSEGCFQFWAPARQARNTHLLYTV